MLQVSRDNNLKIPKKVENISKNINSQEDKIAIKQAISTANNEKINKNKIIQEVEEDKELEQSNKIPFNANDLVVITTVKKLTAYTIAVTEKSPKKFRGVFVNRMQNYCLDTLENLLKANFTRIDEIEKSETIWSQRRSIAENNFAYRLEENDIEEDAETQVMIDVSGSVNLNMEINNLIHVVEKL